jgi:hypothetical protein
MAGKWASKRAKFDNVSDHVRSVSKMFRAGLYAPVSTMGSKPCSDAEPGDAGECRLDDHNTGSRTSAPLRARQLETAQRSYAAGRAVSRWSGNSTDERSRLVPPQREFRNLIQRLHGKSWCQHESFLNRHRCAKICTELLPKSPLTARKSRDHSSRANESV